MKEKFDKIIDDKNRIESFNKPILPAIMDEVLNFNPIPSYNHVLIKQENWPTAVALIQTQATSSAQSGQLACIYNAYQSTIDLPDFIQYCQTLKVSHTALGLLAIAVGCPSSLEAILTVGSNVQNQCFLRYNNYDAFRLAATVGNVSMLEQLLVACDDDQKTIFTANECVIFQKAVRYGHRQLLRFLFEKAPELKATMVECCQLYSNYDYILYAASSGHLETINYLVAQFPEYIERFLNAHIVTEADTPFQHAARQRHLHLMKYLWELAADKNTQLAMLKKGNYSVFQDAAQNGDIEMIRWLLKIAPDDKTRDEMISSNGYAAFIYAAQNNHIPVMELLLSLKPGSAREMIKAKDFSACCFINLATFKFLLESAPELRHDMVCAANYRMYWSAASKGSVDLMKYLAETMKDDIPAMLRSDTSGTFGAFKQAAKAGNIPVMAYLLNLAPKMQLDMVRADDYAVFVVACERGERPVIDFLKERFSEEKGNMLEAQNHGGFKKAAENGHLDIIELLFDMATAEQQQSMIRSADDMLTCLTYSGILNAAKNGHLHVFNYLLKVSNDKPIDIIKTFGNYVWIAAVTHDHLHILHRLNEIAGDEVNDIIAADNFSILETLDMCWGSSDTEVVDFLFSVPSAFAYAELRREAYGQYLTVFVANKLAQLAGQAQIFEHENPHSVFDIDDEQVCELGVYLIRYLTSNHDEASSENISFLLNIPGIHNRVHLKNAPEREEGDDRLVSRISMFNVRTPHCDGSDGDNILNMG